MSKFNFQPLVNTRTQKDEFSKNIIATSAVGTFRVPPFAANQLGIADGDAVSVFSNYDEETKETTFYIAKGYNGTPKLDEKGNPLRNKRNMIIYEEDDNKDGAIVRHTTENSSVLTITSATAWRMLGGSKDHELEVSVTSIGEMDYPLASGTPTFGEVFEMKVVKTRELDAKEKADRDAKASTAKDVDEDIAAEVADQDYVEEEV